MKRFLLLGLFLPALLFGAQIVEKGSLTSLMKKRQATLLFVGNKSVWKSHYLKGSKQIELDKIEKKAYKLLPGRLFTVVIYSDKMKTALDAADLLKRKKYKKIYVLKIGDMPKQIDQSEIPKKAKVPAVLNASRKPKVNDVCEDEIILYGRSTCGRCANMRKELKEHDIHYTEYDVDKDQNAVREMWRKIKRDHPGARGISLPVMEINGKIVLNKYRYAQIEDYLGKTCNVVAKGSDSEDGGERLKIQLYADAIGKFTLDPPRQNLKGKIRFKGSTTYAILWFQVSKKSGIRHDMKYIPKNSSFDLDYYFKDGVGIYDIKIFGAEDVGAKHYKGLTKFQVTVTKTVDARIREATLNKAVVRFVEKHKGEKIGRGECWDVAAQALDENGADWNNPLHFGIPLDPEKDRILPGDIIQFKSVKTVEFITNVKNGRTSYGKMTSVIGSPDHTAVVYRVLGKNDYEVMHQNVGGKRYIVKGEINLNGMVQGQVWFYRPIKGLVPHKDK